VVSAQVDGAVIIVIAIDVSLAAVVNGLILTLSIFALVVSAIITVITVAVLLAAQGITV
jgi:hypothetical protein